MKLQNLFIAFNILISITTPVIAGSELMSSESRNRIFKQSQVVIEGKVLSHSKVYLSQGKQLPENKLKQLTEDELISEVDEEGVPSLSSKKAKIPASTVTVIHTVIIQVASEIKGRSNSKTILCIWRDPYMALCSHVGVSAKKGSSVSCYIKKEFSDGIYRSDSFHIGNPISIKMENKAQ